MGEILIEPLARGFSLEGLKKFLSHKNFTEKEEEISIDLSGDLNDSVLSIKYVADKRLEDIKHFRVYAIKLKEEINERSSKKKQFQIAKDIMRAYSLSAGLFIFYTEEGKPFRFSLVFREAYGTKAVYSPYKRFTYFVSPEFPNKTFIRQVGNCQFENLNEIKSAFSVQPLTKEFYDEIQTWFYHALKNYEKEIFFPGGSKEENLIRLITRLMFVWFIKQMGLIPNKLFDPKELKNIVKDFGKGHNYYNAILQNLFFATLNRPINERRWAKDDGEKDLYRYEDKFLITPKEVLKLFEDIPFINGGLFDCLDKDSQYIDGFSRNRNKQAKVPDKYFFQEEEIITDLSKFGLGKKRFRGLISIFKDYNWTTDESSPIDQEVALDPELLGKVFENLLASYNPETATTARKATGSYYTPKEIVDYMVEESLKEYFKNKTKLSEEKIEKLFYQEEPELSKEEKEKIVQAIADVKIIDPACGSGAFCVGVLHKLVEILNKIDPKNELWKLEQMRRITEEISEKWNDMSKEEREDETQYLIEVFNEQKNYPDYARKLYLIQNCIYGVDIQNIAVQLTKLRFFLTLILDQKPDKNRENFGILPLPNLETKFVCANTLIGLKSFVGLKPPKEIPEIMKDLKRIREKYFRVRDRKQKKELEEKDRELREKLAKLLKKQGWDSEDVKKIASFDILDPTARADWFDHEWMFGVDGFDIVIGNPPYVRQEKIKKEKPLLQKQGYEFFTSTADLYVYFYEKGYKILKQKQGGILAYITSNKWMRAKYGEKLRRFLKENTTILKLIDFSGYRVFEQTVDTCILLFKKEKPPKGHIFKFLEVKSNVESLENYLKNANWQKMEQDKLSNNGWILGDEKVLSLKEKIEKVGRPLRAWNVKIYRGIITGYNEAFIIDTETRNRILANCKDEEERKRTEEIIKPVLRGRDIERYRYKWAGLWIIIIPAGWTNKHRGREKLEEFFKRTFPALYNHFMNFANVKGKGKGLFDRDDQGDYWWELRPCDYYPEFEKEKIVWQEMSLEPSFAYDDIKFYTLQTAYIMTGKNLKFLLGVLNSKISKWYMQNLAYSLSEGAQRWIRQYVEQLPIPPITPQNQPLADQIVQKVNHILSLTQSPDYEINKEKQEKVKVLEKEIDQLVYKLYGLTEEEIKIIEGGYHRYEQSE
ncbi:MAG: Eco57I restriction-modification methylase domain-containing protein [Thermocrinis sp.]|uniref:Eco57I restriction-modification methylase domain-containing protein n=1 Tax=Thermocrinis sp. TaxID=2024383 RepID=UPI003BFE51FD